MKTNVINVRVSEDVKKQSTEIFKKIGLTTSQAIEIYLKAVIKNKGIPFKLKIPNDETLKAIYEAEHDINMTTCDSIDDMWDKIENDGN